MNEASEMYLDSVKQKLICSAEKKSKVIRQLTIDLEEFAADSDTEITLDMLEVHFGTAEEVAQSFLTETDSSEIRAKISKKRAMIIVSVIAVVALILIGVVASIKCYKAWHRHLFPDGYIEGTPVYILKEGETAESIIELPEGATRY